MPPLTKPTAITVVADELWMIAVATVPSKSAFHLLLVDRSNARSSSSAYLKNGDEIADVYTLQALIVPAVKLTDTLRFEAGFGYRVDNADGAPGFSQKNDLWVAYLQALVTLAPGVYLCPEVGYYDFMDGVNGDSQGYQWYAGAKWQIDF